MQGSFSSNQESSSRQAIRKAVVGKESMNKMQDLREGRYEKLVGQQTRAWWAVPDHKQTDHLFQASLPQKIPASS
jgi:hypothetical protein